MVIWKFTFAISQQFVLEMPANAKILTVQAQREVGTLWVLCDKDKRKEQRTFSVVGTGHEFEPVGEYIGTFQQAGGTLVWHLFELT